jgi:hypothetical protein
MNQSNRKKTTLKRVLGLPDLDYAKGTMLNTLGSPCGSRKLDLRALGYSTTGFPIQHTRLARLLRGAAFSIDATSPEETFVVTQTGFAPGSKAATAPR